MPGDTYSSRVRRFNVAAALAATFLPVTVEPVKEILSIPSIAVIQGPKLSSPDSAWTTPGGKHCRASSANLRAVYGVYGDGLTMIVLPMRTAGALQELKSGNGEESTENMKIGDVHLANVQETREVPWNNSSNYSKWFVSRDNLPLRGVFEDLIIHFNLRHGTKPSYASSNFKCCLWSLP